MGKRHIPGHLRRKDKKKSAGTAAFAVCLALLVLLVLLIGAVIGRYQRQLHSDVSVRAKEFYFTSDFLDGETHTLAPGSTEVTFTLSNHADELRFSEVDIDYTVTVNVEQAAGGSGGGTAGTSDGGAENNEVSMTSGTGKLAKGSVNDTEVTISNLQAGTYVITAVGTGGYSKTLTAKIVVPAKEGKLYYHLENAAGEYKLLTVWNEGDVSGEVTITYTGIPDNTNPNMSDWVTGTDIAQMVSVDPHVSKVFRFFNGSNITVTGSGVTPKTPN